MSPTAAVPASRVIVVLLTAFVVMLGLVACGGSPSTGGGGSNAAAPGSDAVVIKGFAFSPGELTVAPGSVVKITNQDTATHTFTATDGSFDSGDIAGGQTGQITAPTAPGRYSFACVPHPFMTHGTLVVS